MDSTAVALRELDKLLEWKRLNPDEVKSVWFYDGAPLYRDWNGCPYVNPLCPNDLCFLPYGHPGMWDGVHMLGTSAEPSVMQHKGLHPLGQHVHKNELWDLGWRRQHEMFPEHHANSPPSELTIDPDLEMWL